MSRTRGMVQCKLCEKGGFEDDGRIELTDVSGKTITFMKYTCQYCGHTVLFDMSIPHKTKYQGSADQEIIPD